MIATAFVDYDNFRLRIPEKNPEDVEFNLGALIRQLLDQVRGTGGIKEVDVRLYGGWIDESGSHTRIASWLLASAQTARGRWQGVSVRPSLIKATIWQPTYELHGTYRSMAVPPRQKMVDGLMMVDLMFYAQNDTSRLFLISDDDDLVPAVLAASGSSASPISWIRLCAAGERPNDSTCERAKVRFANLRRTL